MNRYQRGSKGDLDREFLAIPFRGFGKPCDRFACVGQMTDRFQIGRAFGSPPAGLQPIICGAAQLLRCCKMLRQYLWLADHPLRELFFEHLSDPGMKLLAGAPKQGAISDVLYKGMLEEIGRFRRRATA